MFDQAALTPERSRQRSVERAWAQLLATGPTLTSAERHHVIDAARAAWSGAQPTSSTAGALGDLLVTAAQAIAVDAEGVTADLVAELEAGGLDRFRYIEVLGIVARLSNIDWYVRGIGAAVPTLPNRQTVEDVPPTGRVDDRAVITDSWVPMMSPAMAPHVLDALPDEGEALRDLHEPMYVSMSTIVDFAAPDLQPSDTLSRVQIEYLAARTSYLNECFY